MATNPAFEKLVAATPSSFSADFRLRPMPKLADAIKAGGNLQSIAQAHDMAMQQWSQDAERSINERISQAANKPLPKSAAAASSSGSKTGTSGTGSVTGVTSVNGESGAVELSTDNIPPTATNQYMTKTGWLNLFDNVGFVQTYIPMGASIYIPPNRGEVVPGPLTIDGTLVIDGRLLIL